jgi:hypothetical protein
VPVAAAWAVLAEATRIPWALINLLVGLHVLEEALLVAALAELRKVPAVGHSIVVQLVQEVAVVTLFAKAAQPVLAHDLVAP